MDLKFDPSRCPLPPFKHQLVGTQFLLDHPRAGLFDEMGVSKSKQVIDAAQTLFAAGEIQSVVVVCPAGVRGVWDDPDPVFGEIAKHAWTGVPYSVFRFDARTAEYTGHWDAPPDLRWVITNYEFIRAAKRLKQFTQVLATLGKFLLVLDESHNVKSGTTAQFKACEKVKDLSARTALLTGTPLPNGILDIWAPMQLLDPWATWNLNFTEFRNVHVIMGGYKMKQVLRYRTKNVEKLNKHLARWVIRREKDECFDLPPKIYERLEVPLSSETWRIYCEMRDTCVAWLDEQTEPGSVAVHGAVKLLRLSQITGGFLGSTVEGVSTVKEIGREKLNALLEWADERTESMIVWCHFTPEIGRAITEFRLKGRGVVTIAGGQTDRVRTEAKYAFQEEEGVVLIGQPQAGGVGLNLTRAKTVVYLSNDHNLVTRLQSEDRSHGRGGEQNKVTYLDVIATGPDGQKTIDHVILKALLKKEDVARWTYKQWRDALQGG